MNAASVTATAMTHGFTDGGLMESEFSAAFDIATSTDFHTRLNGHAGSQHVFGILVLVEANTYRKPLYDLHVIASRVLRRKKAEHRAGGTRKILNRSIVIAVEGVDVDRHTFAGAHVVELYFFEICRHPDVIEGYDGE